MEVREMAMAAAAAAASVGGGGGGGGVKLPPPNPNLPYREDCWSDGETAALVAAWGSRYVELNRGNLRQKQWQEVADAVNRRGGASARRRPPRTDIQCKNRVDTLKKKYKAELARSAPSGWNFFPELDRLVGPTLSASGASKRLLPSLPPQFALPIHPPAIRRPPSPSPPSSSPPPPPMALPLPSYRRGSPLPAAALIQKEAAAAAAAVSDSEDSDDARGNNNHNSPPRSPSRSVSSLSGNNKKRSRDEAGSSAEKGFKELARAIEAFAEMYERVESAKQKHAVEMERQRIEFLKQLEVKRMENFVDAHVKLARAKRTKKTTGGAADGAGAMELVATVAAMPFVSTSTFL